MSRIPKEPASIFDIVTFGYKQSIKSLGTVSRICWPWFATYAIVSFLFLELTEGVIPVQEQENLSNLLAWLTFYLNYVITLYARNVYWQKERSEGVTLKPDRTFLGWICVLILTAVYGLSAGILALLGFLLLLVPGVAIVSYFYIWGGLFVTAYILQPEEGVWAARHLIARMLRGNFKRTAVLGFSTGLIGFILGVFPTLIITNMVFIRLQPSPMSHSLWFIGLYVALDTLVKWFSLCFGFTADCFIFNRYYEDLQVRQNQAFHNIVNIGKPSPKATNVNL